MGGSATRAGAAGGGARRESPPPRAPATPPGPPPPEDAASAPSRTPRERRLNLVIAPPRPPCRRFAREDTQQEVELGVCRDAHPVHWFSPSEVQTQADRCR